MALAVLGDVAILRGVDASKPSDNATGVNGTQGRLYFATDTGKAYRDNGTTWDELHIIDNVTTAAHIADTSAAHAASAIGFSATGALASTDVQTAIAELDTEKQPIDSDLTAIAALTPTDDDLLQRKSGAWANRTIAQVVADLIAAGSFTEGVQDVIGAMIAAAGGSYNDGANTITLPSGFTNPMTTQDDIIIGGSSGAAARLAKGSDGQVLTVDPTTHHLIWATPSGGGAALTVEEVDGSPTDSAITKIVFPNGTLGIASHVATYTPSGGSSVDLQLGEVSITSNTNNTAITNIAPVDFSGLSLTLSLATTDPFDLIFSLYGWDWNTAPSSDNRLNIQLWDATAGVEVGAVLTSPGDVANTKPEHIVATVTPPSTGSRTYKVRVSINIPPVSVSLRFLASATHPTRLYARKIKW